MNKFDDLSTPFSEKREVRSSAEDPRVPVSASNFLEFFGLSSDNMPRVTIESALSVPAFWAGTNFLSGTLAGLPISVYERGDKGRVKIETGVAAVLRDAVTDDMTSFQWRKWSMDQVLTTGRTFGYAEKEGKEVVNIYPLETSKMTVQRIQGRKKYNYRDRGGVISYEPADIIDIPLMLKPDGVTHYDPVKVHRLTLGLAIAVTKYGARFFNNGGVPPFVVEGPYKTAAGLSRSSKELTNAVKEAADRGDTALAMPDGHKITSIGIDPEKTQMVEVQRFLVEQIARIFSLPPVFLQDLTHGTFTNTEQQDLHLVKHTIKRWVVQIEQELTLKLFGRGSKRYVRFNLDGLLRGDFKARMEGLAIAIQNAILKPNEARAFEEREADVDGDQLMIQGATVPVRNNLKPQGATV